MSDSLQPHRLYSPRKSPGQNTGVGSLSRLRGIIPTPGSNPGLLHCRWILYQLSHKGSPRILERLAYPFSSRSSWPRNWAGVSCIAGRFFYQLSYHGTPCIEIKYARWHYTALTYSFTIWNQFVVPCLVLTVASWAAYIFLRRQVR